MDSSTSNDRRATAQSETGSLLSVILRHPREAFADSARIEAQWKDLGYHSAPNLGRAVAEYDQLVGLIEGAGVDVFMAPDSPGATLDSLYVRDAAITTDAGVILCAMGKRARAAEPQGLRQTIEAAGGEVLGEIEGAGRIEGGDVAWLPGNRLAVGRGYRTNDEGIQQLRELTRGVVEELVVVPLPHWRGVDDVFHLMSILSPVDADAVLVYGPLLPVPFREWLLGRGLRLIEVPDEEFATMGCNVLALAPGDCLMVEGNPRTRRRLEDAGIAVRVFAATEICRKGEGGPTCLTRPLLRRSPLGPDYPS